MPKRMVALAAAVLTIGTSLLAGSTSPAVANSGSEGYKTGDAPAAIDITRLRVDNADKRVTMRVKVRNLGSKGTFDFYYWRGGTATPPPRTAILEVERVDGEAVAKFFVCGLEDCAPAPCAGVTASWRPVADVVEVSMPQRCYPRAEGTAPPTVGRFFADSALGDKFDGADGDILKLKRG